MNFYFGGCFLVKLNFQKNWETKYPKIIWSVSNCINKIYPEEWGISWVYTPNKMLEEVKQDLKINDADFRELQLWVTKKFDDENFGWPNVFMNLKTAREFNNKFLNKIEGVKLISIYLSDFDTDKFLLDEVVPEGIGQNGIYENLKQKIDETKEDCCLGYEVLGYEMGSFHSFVCNNLGYDYSNNLGLNFNSKGLIDSYDDAKKALSYTISDELKAEPCNWKIWKIKEFSLNDI